MIFSVHKMWLNAILIGQVRIEPMKAEGLSLTWVSGLSLKCT